MFLLNKRRFVPLHKNVDEDVVVNDLDDVVTE